jgi:sigma-B regulation protein RsbU (phosphoserine phosphatase)
MVRWVTRGGSDPRALVEAAERMVRFGCWEWDLRTNRLWWSDNLYRVLGLEPGAVPPTFESYLAIVHPEDREVVAEVGRRALEEGAASAQDFRIVRPDGDVRTLAGLGEPVSDATGRVVAIVGTSQDVTERVRAVEASRESEERYRALMEHAPEAIVVLDADSGRFDHVNENACRLFGLPRERLLACGPIELSPPVQADGRPSMEAANTHIAAAIAGETPVFEWQHLRADGSVVPCEIRLVRLPSNDRVLVRGSLTDITERRRTQRELARAAIDRELATRSRNLQRVTDAALSSLSLERLLPEIVGRLREALQVENAALLLKEDDRLLALRAAAGLEADSSFHLAVGEGFAGRVAESREPLAISGEQLQMVRNPALRELRSLLGVPLLLQGEVIGVVHVGSRVERAFTDEDVELLRLAGDRVALAVEHARVYEHEHAIADALQRSLLPERLPELPGITLAARFRPARYQVGGDFYDVFPVDDDTWLLVIGDVCGKGPEAASLTALARYTLRAEAQHDPRPAHLLAALDAAIVRQRSDGRFLTAIVASLQPNAVEPRLTVSVGGHPPPIHVSAKGIASEIGARGPLVGVALGIPFEERGIPLAPGDSVVLYTDGLLEADAPARVLAPADLARALDGCRSGAGDLATLAERAGVAGSPTTALRDDIAILAFSVATTRQRAAGPTKPPRLDARSAGGISAL